MLFSCLVFSMFGRVSAVIFVVECVLRVGRPVLLGNAGAKSPRCVSGTC